MTTYTSKTWPIAAAMLPFTNSQDADTATWVSQLSEVAYEGFEHVDITDCWIQPGNLDASGLERVREALDTVGLEAIALSAIRKSVIDPVSGDDNLAYSHRTLDAAAKLGLGIVSFGLHRPLLPNQQEVQWFWTEEGPVDNTDPETWELAISRIRELGQHAADLGIELSLEMYEDTLIGTTEGVVRIVDGVGLDNVGVNPDLGNLYRLHREIESFQSAVETLAPISNYWHVKNYYRDEDRNRDFVTSVPAPMESGSMNYRAAIKTALAAGYNAAFCVEHYGGDGLSVTAANARYIRKLIAVANGEAEQEVLAKRAQRAGGVLVGSNS